jgi:hypothetical protein
MMRQRHRASVAKPQPNLHSLGLRSRDHREGQHMLRITIALTILVSVSTAAAAERERLQADADARKPEKNPATQAAASGELSPFSVSPRVPKVATAVVLSGYDSAANGLRARGAGEGRLASFLAARVEYEHGPGSGPSDRVSLGLRATFLNQATHGVELGALVFYQPRDFREEGNLVGGLLVARRFDRLTLVFNPLVGSDTEGDDVSFELRFAGLYKAGSWLVVGLDSRGRYNLSSDQKRAGSWAIDWEAQGGASAAFGIGPLLISTLVGPSFLQRSYLALDGTPGERQLRPGLLAMAGAGATF